MRITLSETFVSIQGEGLDVGQPAFFIRTGRCSVGCKFCDTRYAWNSKKTAQVTEIVKEALKSKLPEVIITGGEPLEEENLPLLIRLLSKEERIKRITIETCGHIFRDDLPGEKLKIVLSPKPPTMGVTFPEESLKKFLKTYERAYIKFGVFSQKDFETIKTFAFKNSELIKEPIVIQPLETPFEDYIETCRRVTHMVVEDREFVNAFSVRIIPQVHKLIGLK
ncbi:7-carboxy-7-deazaguanine synthase QueE [Phorcysia thermohydrogeniphila]|uniref:7-carboxy-7-deazaguanine synthase n=1 Tax=Phorcysia thermohydrogeniphila TaxID=936138 RepID=A0A4R1GPX4_9BACT|nr:7-carboxy-7-deazaguanine synthase QueE [Phorcysia thermohydrogeniphila]TCK06552.1 7-carboxy-7-deazaguanine synthase [Phorcysia thermohydrogeniphila]